MAYCALFADEETEDQSSIMIYLRDTSNKQNWDFNPDLLLLCPVTYYTQILEMWVQSGWLCV